MINFGHVIKEDIKGHNPNLPQILDHSYIILIIGGFGSGKTSELFDLIDLQLDVNKFICVIRIHMKPNTNC